VKLRDTLSAAFRGLSRHWVRALLNLIGVFAGVASVVLLIAVAHAVGGASKLEVEGLGANIVVVYPGAVSSSGVQIGIGTASTLTNDDVQSLGDQGFVPDGVQAVPTAGVRTNVMALSRAADTDVLGSTEGFPSARGYTLREGRFFNGAEDKSAASVIVLGSAVTATIFPGVDPIGQSVTINNHPFTVIGVFAQRGFSGSFNQDDLAVMPIASSWAYVLPSSAERIQQVFVVASTPNSTSLVKSEVTNTLLQRHHIVDPAQADFQVRTQQDLLASAQRIGTVMKWMLAVVAAISLGTGAIGITSLMLTSVRERAYEIGIRRAVGATKRNIVTQFMVESLLLAGAGAIAGIALGFGGAALTGELLPDLPTPIVTWPAVLAAIAVALVIGVGTGLYPAARASRLQPVEAVRRR
jgi:putative ABC transport system permease protein